MLNFASANKTINFRGDTRYSASNRARRSAETEFSELGPSRFRGVFAVSTRIREDLHWFAGIYRVSTLSSAQHDLETHWFLGRLEIVKST